MTTRIRVEGPSPYDVRVGHGLLEELPDLVGPSAHRVAVIHPPGLGALAASLADAVSAGGVSVHPIAVPDGEAAKTAEVAASCWSRLGQVGFTRTDAVVGVGGGSTTDLAGFVAATFLRGLRVVHVPTSLLGMVDAAVGGKTGINTAEGKNLVGAFHEPAGVLCDLDLLASLDPAEMRSGLAEVVKCGFVADTTILDIVEADPAAAADPGSAAARTLVERAIRVKADVVAADFSEAVTGTAGGDLGREVLNYGHTFGHAVERIENYAVRHGEAVAIGMVYVAELAARSGRLAAALVDRHRSVLKDIGLPTTYPAGRWTGLHEAMRRDKKARGDHLRFVILDALGRPAILEGPDPALLVAAYEAVND